MRLFKDDYKELFEIEWQANKDLRRLIKSYETRLAISEQTAVSVLRLYGVEAVDRYYDTLREQPIRKEDLK